MALEKCTECGHDMSSEARKCPNCGWKRPRFKWWLWLPLGGVALLLVLGTIEGNRPGADEKYNTKQVIKMCWDEQARRSLDPDGARLVARQCEGMEAEFVRKYGHRP